MTSNTDIFTSGAYKPIEQQVLALINDQPEFLSARTAGSPRAVGDAIQTIISEKFGDLLSGLSKEFSASFARRAMADVAFTDINDFYYVVDVKTHRINTSFNMPNLTSVERLTRFYEDDRNFFVILKIDYQVLDTKVQIEKATFVPIEYLSWECLTIGALGWGQIQIANANNIILNPQISRKRWMLQLCDTLFAFYPREIEKINERIAHFQSVRAFWQAKPD